MKRIRVIKINKATVVCKQGHPSHQRGLWGQRGNCAWILHICGRTRSAVGLIFVKIVGIIAVLGKIQQRLVK